MPITLLYAGLLGLWLLVLSARVIQARAGAKVSLGDGGDTVLIRRIRGQANFVEYVPLSLILLGLLEAAELPGLLLHGCGLMLLVGRLLHGYAFGFTSHSTVGRMGGTALTFLALALMGLGAVWVALFGQ